MDRKGRMQPDKDAGGCGERGHASGRGDSMCLSCKLEGPRRVRETERASVGEAE